MNSLEQLVSGFRVCKYTELRYIEKIIYTLIEGSLGINNRELNIEFENKKDIDKFVNDVTRERSGWQPFMLPEKVFTNEFMAPNGIKITYNEYSKKTKKR
jgi:hypothetical protein